MNTHAHASRRIVDHDARDSSRGHGDHGVIGCDVRTRRASTWQNVEHRCSGWPDPNTITSLEHQSNSGADVIAMCSHAKTNGLVMNTDTLPPTVPHKPNTRQLVPLSPTYSRLTFIQHNTTHTNRSAQH